MVNWQVTVTTIYCEAVDDEVTLMVYKDGSAKCTGCKKYGEPSKKVVNLVKRKSEQLKRQLECEGPECYRITQYKDKLFAEEAERGCYPVFKRCYPCLKTSTLRQLRAIITLHWG